MTTAPTPTPGYRPGLESYPIEAETTATIAVDGELPDWLDGTLLRNGPGLFEVGGRTLEHWFDGLALLRRYAFDPDSGTVEHAVRYLRSEAFAAARDGRLAHDQFDTPSTSRLGRIRRLLDPTVDGPGTTDNASVSLARIDDEWAAVTETDRALGVDPDALATTGEIDVGGPDLTGSLAHAHHDPIAGVHVELGFRLGPTSEYVLTRRPEGGARRDVVARVPVEQPAYVHSFALTPRYAVVTEAPFVTTPGALLTARSFLDAYEWRPDRGTRLLTVDRETGAVAARPTVDPRFVFHHANAYEVDGELVVDAVAYDDARAATELALGPLRDGTADLPPGELWRYRFDPAAQHPDPTAERLHPGSVEFPCIDYAARNGRPYRHLFLAASDPEPPVGLAERVVHLDLATGETTAWDEPDTYPGEPLFVPRERTGPDGTAAAGDPAPADLPADPDGVLLVELLDAAADESRLLVLDAATLDAVARVDLPERLPLGFHGQYVGTGRHTRSMA